MKEVVSNNSASDLCYDGDTIQMVCGVCVCVCASYKFHANASNQAMTTSFHIFSNPLFTVMLSSSVILSE
jgi:DeoR/GlpR family transcriptional regulator of sugar metabolism